MTKEERIAKIRSYIKRCDWQWAATMSDVPHEYIVRRRCALDDNEFFDFVRATREFGVKERWWKYELMYLYIDGYKYWDMGGAIDHTKIIINRQKIFSEFDELPEIEPNYYNASQMRWIVGLVKDYIGDRSIFEIGTGTGMFASFLGLTGQKYHGCEPSKRAYDEFRKYNPQCNIINKSFEECAKSYLEDDCVFVGIYGSPNYVMSPYLKMIDEAHKDFFMMFYNDNYVPNQLKDTHFFRHKYPNLFKTSYRTNGKNYTIVTKHDLVDNGFQKKLARENQYDKIAEQYDNLFVDENFVKENQQVADMISDMKGSFYDIGCGTGLLLEIRDIQPEDYFGIDPSYGMCKRFAEKFPAYAENLCVIPFANSGTQCSYFKNIVSLFGSPSYLSVSDLKKIASTKAKLFLMFYKTDYTPVTYIKTGVDFKHNIYTKEQLSEIFKVEITEFNNYLIVKK